jgi:glycerol-3-phosphate dehydrogenase (NAD(P)+)
MGAGMWGTTFAQVLCDAGTPAVLWGRRPELTDAVNQRHENPYYLPGVTLTGALRATCDPAAALAGADLIVLAMPAQTLRQNLAGWATLLPPGALLVSLMKGIEHGTHLRMSEVITEITGAGPDRIAVITGPNLAREIAERQYAATVVACADDAMAKHLQQACHTPYFRPYTNPDVIGCELGGAVKNVIALAVGIAAGMGLGDNTRALLITRGLAEMGDLVATCSSPLSRNRTFGENLGRGTPLADAAADASQVTEGVKSAGPVLELAHAHHVEMPITEVVAGVTQGRIAMAEAVMLLASRSAKPERYGL